MDGKEVLRIVDAIQRDKSIDKEIVFGGIEQAILSAARRHFGDDHELSVHIDRDSGEPTVFCDEEKLAQDILGEILGRVAAQTAKQVMIQKIREAERDSVFDEYLEMQHQSVSGSVSRVEGGAVLINLGKIEGILPRGEQIPGESFRVGDRARAIVLDVRKAGSRVKVILSRTHPDMVRRLFELEIPEVSDRIIDVRSLAREAGYRSKVAVSCMDSSIDCVGACVGMRGARIKNIVDELAGERIDIVRWNDSLQVLVPNSLQPAEVEDVILCPMLGRVIVLVREDQLPLAIGRKGQNVRLASKLVGWDIEVMTQSELDEQLDKTVEAFSSIPGVSEELAESLVSQGFFSYYDLSVIEPDQLAELGGLTAEQCTQIVEVADRESERVEAEEDAMRAAKKNNPQATAEKESVATEVEATSEPAATESEAEVSGSEADESVVAEEASAESKSTTDEVVETEAEESVVAEEAAAEPETKTDEVVATEEVPVNAENTTEESTEKQE
ncbi:transcription termination factor NusA [uncultured Gimesia sp.]|uniref:transcription termination factor NusA n=1 Tax=uncultured Gimesia sp. TaxID=1678688 RepID=UPI002608DB6B|nr:transcription termination factor NusA [uncultured Gimesia sp.]